MGFCGRIAELESHGRCHKHKGLTEIPKRDKQAKFRGDSKWAKEQGMFDGKKEN